MSARPLPEAKSADRAAFDHYLRTGQRFSSEEWLAQQEAKFNPNHDELGRFTFSTGPTAGAGRTGMAAQPNGGQSPGRAPQRAAPAKPVSRLQQQPSRSPTPARDRDAVAKRQRDIGTLAAKYESGKLEGPGTISSGRNDPGGVSYGTFQMSLKDRVVHDFVASPEASVWAARFRGKTSATKPFDDEWQSIAASDPAVFESAQREFVVRKNYSVGAQKVRQEAAYELERASPRRSSGILCNRSATRRDRRRGGSSLDRYYKSIKS